MISEKIKNSITVLKKHEMALVKVIDFLKKLGFINAEDQKNKTSKYPTFRT